MFRLSVALLLLLLLAVAAAERVLSPGSHSQGPGQGSKLLSLVGQGGGGSPAEQPPPPQLLQQQQQQSQQQQQQPQPPQPPFPAGGPPARRGGAGPGGTGGGWKLAEEESCREDVTRVCPKHTWSNNLAVLECLQDVREVRRWAGPGRRAGPAAGRGCRRPGSADAGWAAAAFPAPHSRVHSGKRTPPLPSQTRDFSPGCGAWDRGPWLLAAVRQGLGA